MLAFRNCVRIAGAFLLMIGFLSLPAGFRISPKSDQSAFLRAADTGAFLHFGLALFGVGLLMLIVSFIMPPRDE